METTHVISRRAGFAIGLAAAGTGLLAASAHAAETKGGVKITVLYGAPKDPAAFDTYYLKTHMPMVYAVKGIARTEVAKLLPGPDGKAPPFYRITEIWFESADAMKEIVSRPEWKKIAADVPNFADGGATVFISQVD